MPSSMEKATVKATQAATNTQQHREESPREVKNGVVELEASPHDCKQQVFIDAREWEGRDLNQTVEREALTTEQAFSIMRLRQAIGKPKAAKSEDELVEAMWQDLQAKREESPDNELDQDLTEDIMEAVQQQQQKKGSAPAATATATATAQPAAATAGVQS